MDTALLVMENNRERMDTALLVMMKPRANGYSPARDDETESSRLQPLGR